MLLFHTSDSCFGVLQAACAPSGWWVHFDGGPPCMIRCSTTQLIPFQYNRHGCGPTCRCYVNSSLHFVFMPGHFKPREEEVKSQRCLSTSACMLLYWSLCDACCTLPHDFPDIWYLCTCYYCLAVSQHYHHSSFEIVGAAFLGFQKISNGVWNKVLDILK